MNVAYWVALDVFDIALGARECSVKGFERRLASFKPMQLPGGRVLVNIDRITFGPGTSSPGLVSGVSLYETLEATVRAFTGPLAERQTVAIPAGVPVDFDPYALSILEGSNAKL